MEPAFVPNYVLLSTELIFTLKFSFSHWEWKAWLCNWETHYQSCLQQTLPIGMLIFCVIKWIFARVLLFWEYNWLPHPFIIIGSWRGFSSQRPSRSGPRCGTDSLGQYKTIDMVLSVWDGLWRPGGAFFQIGFGCVMSHHHIERRALHFPGALLETIFCNFGQICATGNAFVRLIVGRSSILNFPAKIWTGMCKAHLCGDDSSHSQSQSGKRLLLAFRGQNSKRHLWHVA